MALYGGSAMMQGGYPQQSSMQGYGGYGEQYGQQSYDAAAYGQMQSPYPGAQAFTQVTGQLPGGCQGSYINGGGASAAAYNGRGEGGCGMSGAGIRAGGGAYQPSTGGVGGYSAGGGYSSNSYGGGRGYGSDGDGYGMGGYGGSSGYGRGGDEGEGGGDEFAGWRQEYSQGAGPEYEAEALWTAEADGDEMAEVNVFGPPGDLIPPAVTSFDAASALFPPALIQKLQSAGFTAPTPIQAHTWAIAVAGRDVIGIAKTGSGKTLAFLMPGFVKILQARGARPPLLCILAPTRELACQIEAEAIKFGQSSGIRTACCYGGAPRGQQMGALRRGAQIVVACPGRLNDFIQSGTLSMANVSYLVLDEADRMLDMGFEPQIRQIIQNIPDTRQTLLFTATWPREVRSLASEFLQKPIHVQTGAVDVMTVNKDITQRVIFVNSEQDKPRHLITILQGLSPGDRCLIFCEMKRNCEMLATELTGTYGVSTVRIHGDLAQYERTAALDAFKNGRSPIMVATDVAARGIDVKGVTVVINYDASGSAKDYVHRIGRTGRAGQKGTAYTLLMPREEKKAQDIIQVLQRSGMAIPEELQALVVQRGRQGRAGYGNRKGGKGGKGFKGKGFGKGNGGGGGKGFGGQPRSPMP